MTELVAPVEVDFTRLPENWTTANLAEFTEVTLGQSPPSGSYNSDGDGLPFFQGKAEFNSLYPDVRKWCSQPKKVALKDDVLLSVRAPVGPTNICPDKACIGRGLASIRGVAGIETKFVLHLLRAFQNDLAAKATGTTFPAVTGQAVKSLELPLPPLNEQHRIVEKIEELFTRLDAGVEALKHARTQLKKYRQSVLDAAVTGELSREWRETHTEELEPASELLERILEERREKWSGKKYKEPVQPDTDGLPGGPEGWHWASVDQLAAAEQNSITDGPYGSNLKTAHYTDDGPRVIRLQNVAPYEFIDERAHISTEHYGTLLKHAVYPGDLVIRALGEPAPVACMIPNDLGEAIVKADCIRLKVASEYLSPSYIMYALNSSLVQAKPTNIIHGIGRPRLNLSEIKSIAVPIPPRSEQSLIAEEVERRFSVIDQLEATIEDSLKRSESLRQSILKRAFSGRLVEQNPDDEPAGDLLERIREERQAKGQNSAKRRRRAVEDEESLF